MRAELQQICKWKVSWIAYELRWDKEDKKKENEDIILYIGLDDDDDRGEDLSQCCVVKEKMLLKQFRGNFLCY
jgi:hypothetical protein